METLEWILIHVIVAIIGGFIGAIIVEILKNKNMKKLKTLSVFLLVVAYVSFVSAGFMYGIVNGLSVLGAVSLTYGLIGGIYAILSDENKNSKGMIV